MAKNWTKIIEGLKKLIGSVGSMWPDSTKLAGFGSAGPYHCANCEYLNSARNRCNQEVMMADPEVEHDENNLAVITDPEHQCCEFVEPVKKLVQIEIRGFMEHEKKRAHHGFHTTTMKHHADGSITMHHQHHDGPHKDVEHAVPSLDHAHDSLQEHLGVPNPGEAEAEKGPAGSAAHEAAESPAHEAAEQEGVREMLAGKQ